MKNNILLLMLLVSLLGATIASGQLNKGKKYLAKGEYELAIETIENDLESPLVKPFALEELGNIHYTKSYKGYDLFKTYKYYERAIEEYNNLDSKDKKKVQSKGFRKALLSKKMSDIVEVEMTRVGEEKSVLAATSYLTNYDKTIDNRQRKIVNRWRNDWLLEQATEMNTYEAFLEVYTQYEFVILEYSPELHPKLEEGLITTYIAEKGWALYPNFEEQYPKSIFVQQDKEAYALIKIYRHRTIEKINEYIRAYPNTLFLIFAKQYLFELTKAQDNLEAYDYFLRTYPDYHDNEEMWKHFYDVYLEQKGQASVVEFDKQYPNYPFRQELQNNVKYIKDIKQKPLVDQAIVSESSEEMLQFLQKYPNSTYIDMLEEPLSKALVKNGNFRSYTTFLNKFPRSEYYNDVLELLYQSYAKDGEWASINQFMVDYPAYENTEQLKKDMAIAEQGAYLNLTTTYTSKYNKQYEDYIRAAAPKERAFVALQRMIEADIIAKNWALAIGKMQKFDSYFGQDPKFLGLQKLLKDKDLNIQKNNLGTGINTNEDEYVPIITVDNEQIYFCRWDRTNENIYVSENKKGTWQTATYVQGINVDAPEENEGALSISADKTEMLIFKNGDLYASQKTAEGWMAPVALSNVINTSAWEADAMISSDGRALIFTSKRPDLLDLDVEYTKNFHGDNSGNADLFVSLKDKNGEWQEPINLGIAINTPFLERTPFLHPDMKTLYFSSDGHGGLGRLDVYKTTRLDDSWTNWSTPINLGKSINTPQNDWGYKVSTDGTVAYFAYEEIAEKGQDLYQINLPKALQPNTVSIITGKLTTRSGEPLFAEIIWEDLTTGEEVGRLKSDPNTGTFYIALPNDRKYSYFIQKEGYYPKSNNIDLTNKKERVTIEGELSLVKIEEMIESNKAVSLQNLFFDPNEYTIQNSSYLELNRLVELVTKYDLQVYITGHTDNEGSEADNLKLSKNRANAVRDYLISKGCNSEKVKAEGYGEKKPISTNNTAIGKQLNRRVEVSFSK